MTSSGAAPATPIQAGQCLYVQAVSVGVQQERNERVGGLASLQGMRCGEDACAGD